jgi:Fe-S-cluster containining protein
MTPPVARTGAAADTGANATGAGLARDAPTAQETRPTRFRVAELTRASRFSYACHACSRCCHNYDIKVNPYEVTALARHLGMSTTAFSETHTAGGPFLKRTESGACAFLGPRGCTVHAARPLVCRLYPLGLEQTREHGERFFHMQPHPETAGEYGTSGTVGDFLDAQGAEPFLDASNRYGEVLGELLAVLRSVAAAGETDVAGELLRVREQPGYGLAEWLDPDRVLAQTRPGLDPGALTGAETTELHIEELHRWIATLQEDTDDED